MQSSLYDPTRFLFAFSLNPTFVEFSKEEYQGAKVDPIAQFAKPVTVYVESYNSFLISHQHISVGAY